jgi:leucine dehydrogenase
MVGTIYDIIGRIFAAAERDQVPSWQAAERLAEERIRTIGRIRLPYTGQARDRYPGRRPHTLPSD